MSLEERLTDIEIHIVNQERIVDELNAEVLRLSRLVDMLEKQVKHLKDQGTETLVKPLSEEVPPPHY